MENASFYFEQLYPFQDLDLFVNDDDDFPLYADRLLHVLRQTPGIDIAAQRRDERFMRATALADDVMLKIELVNDVPSHVGEIVFDPILGRLDSIENILANKITAAIDRTAARDLADIWAICTRMNLSLERAIEDAGSKAMGILAPDLARVLCSATVDDWREVNWIHPPDREQFLTELRQLGESLIL